MSQENDIDMSTFESFLQVHRQQLESSNVPVHYWQTLFLKLKHEVYDAGSCFQMQQIVCESEDGDSTFSWRVVATAEEGIDIKDPNHIYLIDHAWTYRIGDARAALNEVQGLKERMAALMDISAENMSNEEIVEEVLSSMWKFCQTYKFGHLAMGSDEAMPLWYVMDEFGSRIQHSDDPSVRIVPFYYAELNLAFSLMWPTTSLEEGDEVTRNYVENQADSAVRSAKLVPWVPCDLKHVSFKNEEPSLEHFQSFRLKETLPTPSYEFPGLPRDRNLKVFLEYPGFAENLNDRRFEVVDSADEADVLWFSRHFHDFEEFSETRPAALINQFPNEMVVTVKDMLALTARRAATPGPSDPMEANPKWLPITYDLQTELPKFVSYFQHREEKGEDNHWICKPWNLARGLDMYITKSLDQIVRLPDAGPKVACKYIEDPVLYFREDVGGKVKFDIRYIVLLSSAEPLKLFAYKVFWLRFANKPYSLDHLDDYQKHFTVMNYVEGADEKLKQVHYDDFIPEFESQNPGFVWTDVENDIFNMIKELFVAATSVPPPRGICASPQSRAMYAVDLMLSWATKPTGEKYMQPMICEVNFSPDCARACKYHPFFVDDVFSVLFLDDTEDKHVTPL
ncbi:tubulin--tyrosine ligase-like protein 12 [Aplysia californica]|uniref:Tubulin--tyrosine ligase-like protein 12 n=1 Tax=Aplysia californica TaxID=6500 RepID=A0ABM0JUT0_APLCA|nr:tubulin--tyrosine ligase-like protein 12 [Aplysia californica]